MKMKLLRITIAAAISSAIVGTAAFGQSIQKSDSIETESFFGDWDKNRGDDFPNPMDSANIKLVNTCQWSSSDIAEIEVAYGYGSICLLPGQAQEIVLKEYMSEDNPSFYARTSVSGDKLKLENTSIQPKPPTNYYSYMELYIPMDFGGTFNLQTTNGAISIRDISATMIFARSSNGQIDIANFSGELDMETANGGIYLSQCEVKGKLHTANGRISLGISNILGDITVTSGNGEIAAALPETSSFNISASVENGNITNEFSSSWPINDTLNGATLNGVWKEDSKVTISLSSVNGFIGLYRTINEDSKYSDLSDSILK